MSKKFVPFLAPVAVFLIGVTIVIIGLVKASGYAPLKPADLREKNVGKSLNFSVLDCLPVDDGCFLAVIGEEDATCVLVSIPVEYKSFIIRTEQQKVSAVGTLNICDEEKTDKAAAAMTAYFDTLRSAYEEISSDAFDEDLQNAINCISPYCINVTAVKENSGSNLTDIGIALIAISLLITALCLLRNKIPVKKILLITASAALILAAAVSIIFKDRLRALASLTKVTDGFYAMTCYGDYHTDEYLNAGLSSIEQLVGWLTKEIFGISCDNVDIDIDSFGCSSFISDLPDGNRLMGRNFDYPETDTLITYNAPGDGFAYIGMVDLDFVGIDKDSGVSPDSLRGKLLMLAASYICLDGVNEKGLGVSILQLDTEKLSQDKGNPDLLVYSAIRCILEKCQTVDEATALLEKYDMHSGLNCSFHLFIADKSGKSAIVEWLDNEMVITGDTAVTNFVLADGKHHRKGGGFDRYDIIRNGLSKGVPDKRGAMLLLSAARDESQTEWSCVYNLTDFSVDVCLDNDYDNTYSFTREDFN